MRIGLVCVLCGATALTSHVRPMTIGDSRPTPPPRPAVTTAFVENRGQFGADVLFAAASTSYRLDLTRSGARLESGALPNGRAIGFAFRGASGNVRMEGVDRLSGVAHYLVGRDRGEWRTHVARFDRGRAHDVYSAVDVEYYAHAAGAEFDVIVRPGGDPDVCA